MASNFIKLRNIKRALLLEPGPTNNYLISGRVTNFRPYKNFNFIDICDGSTRQHLQVVIKRDLINKPDLGSYITCLGKIQSSPGSQQKIELKVDEVKYFSGCDPSNYPLAGNMSRDWFRHKPHLRSHDQNFASLLRVKSDLELSLHMIMRQMDFFRVHTPSLSANDSEASSDLFVVKRSQQTDIGRKIREDYFDKDVFLVTSAQLHLETLAATLSRVYTLSNAFRAENSITTRHLCEFLMFEAEEANVTEPEQLMDRVESLIKFCAQYLSEVSEYKSDFTDLVNKNLYNETFEKIAHSAYIRMSYEEALRIIKERTDFSGPTHYGSDIGRAQERKLLEYCDNVPIFITNFPKQLKPFYMKCDQADKEAQCFDLIAPNGGEICGGSLREDSAEKLIENLNVTDLVDNDKDTFIRQFDWYLDLRRFGSFPHGGFGIGIERLLQSLLGVKNIRDTTAFPRRVGQCPM